MYIFSCFSNCALPRCVGTNRRVSEPLYRLCGFVCFFLFRFNFLLLFCLCARNESTATAPHALRGVGRPSLSRASVSPAVSFAQRTSPLSAARYIHVLRASSSNRQKRTFYNLQKCAIFFSDIPTRLFTFVQKRNPALQKIINVNI